MTAPARSRRATHRPAAGAVVAAAMATSLLPAVSLASAPVPVSAPAPVPVSAPASALASAPRIDPARLTESAVAAERRAFLDSLVALRLEPSLDVDLADDPLPPLEDLAYRIAMARARLSTSDVPADARPAAVAELLDLHARRLVAAGSHPRRPVWALDRAEDAWRWLWPLEVAGVQTLIGVPDATARRRAENAAQIMADATADAARRFEPVLDAIEATPGWADDGALAREHREITADRDGRLALLQSLAGAMRALGLTGGAGISADGSADRAIVLTEAEAALRSIEQDLEAEMSARPPANPANPATPADAAAVDATGATLAQLRWFRGQLRALDGDGARAARTLADAATVAAKANDPFTAAVAEISAAMALAWTDPDGAVARFERLETRVSAAASGDDDATGRFLMLLAADARFRAFAERARALQADAGDASAAAAEQAWRQAGAGWQGFAAAVPGSRSIIIERWARGLRPGDPIAELPVLARLGAERVARSSGDAAAADAWLATVALDAADTDRLTSVRAAESLMRRAVERGDRGEAMRWGRLAAERAVDPTRRRSIVDRLLRMTHAASVASVASVAADGADGRVADFNAAVDLMRLVSPDLPAADQWRSIAASRRFHSGETDGAAALVAEISPDGPAADAAAALRVLIAHRRLDEAAGDTADVRRTRGAATELIAAIEAAGARPAASTPDGPIARAIGGGRGVVWTARARRLSGDLDGAWNELMAADPAGMEPIARAAYAAMSLDLLDRKLAAAAAAPRADGAAAQAAAAAIRHVAGTGDPAMWQALIDRLRRAVDAAMADPRPIDDPQRAADLGRQLAAIRGGVELVLASVAADEAGPPMTRMNDANAVAAIADAHRLGGDDAAAAPWYERLGGASSADPRVLFGVAEAAQRRGDEDSLAAAMTIYRRLGSDRPGAGDHRWWVSQLRMLQILDRLGRRPDSIGPRLERLRRTEPELGGPSVAAGFGPLVDRYLDAASAAPAGAARDAPGAGD